MMRRRHLLAEAVQRLRAANVPQPERDARLLLRWAAGLSAAALSSGLEEAAEPAEETRFRRAVAERADRRPVSHITGVRAFWGREFRVTADVLDPRPETEVLVAAALERPFRRVLDLGTGSGCILLTLLAEVPAARGTGTDTSAAALDVARSNAARLGVAERASFQEADWCTGIEGQFDLIVSNPPYIAEAELAALAAEVRDHEPRAALSPGGDGLRAYRAILDGAGPLLAPQGRLLLEIGATQARDVLSICNRAGLSTCPPIPDFDGRDRVIAAMAQENRAKPRFHS